MKTPVIFRYVTYPDSDDYSGRTEVLTIFPYEPADVSGRYTSCYAHLGQHSGCDYDYILSISRPPTEKEYSNLYNELTNLVGYDLRIIDLSA